MMDDIDHHKLGIKYRDWWIHIFHRRKLLFARFFTSVLLGNNKRNYNSLFLIFFYFNVATIKYKNELVCHFCQTILLH